MKKKITNLTFLSLCVLVLGGCSQSKDYKVFNDIKTKHWTCAHGAEQSTIEIEGEYLLIETESNPNSKDVLKLNEMEETIFELQSVNDQDIKRLSKKYPNITLQAYTGELNIMKVRSNKTIDLAHVKNDQLKDFKENDLGHGCELTETINH
ncbi:hypothetical protein ERUR111494_01095 [Erysipelothrix urinaevulpis]|uniref:hypothetical protein n=1 Tax=Erysipelothrix urinaevulpis TaxID=2683717 RepID=UPI00135887DA|nr:hypothetical protein [Erysipelothrix urinaevulpis]